MFTHTDTFSISYIQLRNTLLTVLALSMCAYVYFLVISFQHAVALRDMDKEFAHIERAMKTLEMRHVTIIRELSEEYALANGYVTLETRAYANSSDTAVAHR